MATTQTVRHGKETVILGDLYMSFELGDRSRGLTLGDGRRWSRSCSASPVARTASPSAASGAAP